MNIIQAVEDPKLFARYFKDATTWAAWRAFLCALFGLPMAPEQLETFRACTGRTAAPSKAFDEAWLIVGRRGGKSFTLALISVFLATFFDWRPHLTVGERGSIVVVAADRKQAGVILRYMRQLLNETPLLARMIAREASEEIDLANNISLEVVTCSYRTIRGRTVVAALADEIAFWLTEGSSNPDEEVLAAIRPAMATIPGAKLLCASSPYARRGALWEAHQKYFGKDDAPVLIWQAATKVMNPSVPQRVFDEAYERDPSVAGAEYGAMFRTDVERLLTREAVTACVNEGVTVRAPDRSKSYYGFIDAAGGSGGDSFTMAISHREGTTAILDAVRERTPPFSPEAVIKEFATVFKSYRISSITGDRFGAQFPVELFQKEGIFLQPSDRSKSEIYADAVAAINSRAVDLLDHSKLINQLIGLERRTRTSGKDQIDHAPGGRDDVANAACGALTGASTAPPSNFNKALPELRYVY